MSAIPAGVFSIRAEACAACPSPCAWQHDTAAQADPCQACPASHWGAYRRCSSTAESPDHGDFLPLPAPKGNQSPIEVRTATHRRAGNLVAPEVLETRRAACSTCDQRREHPAYPGLYGCGSCSRCQSSPERMLSAAHTCPRGLWPT